MISDLIETYWDVKEKTLNGTFGSLWRFNRNILGCKDNGDGTYTLDGVADLIETYWDVKLCL